MTYIDSNTFTGCKSLISITIALAKDDIEDAPWGAPTTTVITWVG
jgi:hypothetical protein